MIVYLFRHGRTQANAERRYLGETDQPLSNEGEAELKNARKYFCVRKVYISPKIRCAKTAEILFPNAHCALVSDLREMNFGDFEMRTADEMKDDEAYLEWVNGMCEGRCPNGEDMAQFRRRTEQAFIEILNENEGKEDVFIVAHGGTVKAVMSRFSLVQRSYWEWNAPFGGAVSAHAEKIDGEWRLTPIEE